MSRMVFRVVSSAPLPPLRDSSHYWTLGPKWVLQCWVKSAGADWSVSEQHTSSLRCCVRVWNQSVERQNLSQAPCFLFNSKFLHVPAHLEWKRPLFPHSNLLHSYSLYNGSISVHMRYDSVVMKSLCWCCMCFFSLLLYHNGSAAASLNWENMWKMSFFWAITSKTGW